MTDDEAADMARRLIRVEMTASRMTFGDLARELAARGSVQNERTLRNKITRGHFSAMLFLQCLEAMEVDSLDLNFGHPFRRLAARIEEALKLLPEEVREGLRRDAEEEARVRAGKRRTLATTPKL